MPTTVYDPRTRESHLQYPRNVLGSSRQIKSIPVTFGGEIGNQSINARNKDVFRALNVRGNVEAEHRVVEGSGDGAGPVMGVRSERKKERPIEGRSSCIPEV